MLQILSASEERSQKGSFTQGTCWGQSKQVNSPLHGPEPTFVICFPQKLRGIFHMRYYFPTLKFKLEIGRRCVCQSVPGTHIALWMGVAEKSLYTV